VKKKNKIIAGILIIFLLGIFAWVLPTKYEIVRNYSESLPYHFVIVKKGVVPNKRDQVFVFYVRNNEMLGVEKVKFIKLVGGLPGDIVENKGGNVFFDKKIYPDIKKPKPFTKEERFYIASLIKLTHPEELQKKKIKIEDREIFVAGKSIGVVKPFTKKFEDFAQAFPNNEYEGKNYKLHPLRIKKIGEHQFFAYTPHKDSFDSRYKEIGLINEKDIIGVAVFAF